MNRQKVYEYIVIGSGPGGATVAKELSLRKKEVCIVEFGKRIEKAGFWEVGPLISIDREDTNSQLAVSISSARILGGSSYVAAGNIIDPSQALLSEWGVYLDEELESAKEEIRAKPVPVEMIGEGTKRINEAAGSLGWEVKPTPKCIDV